MMILMIMMMMIVMMMMVTIQQELEVRKNNRPEVPFGRNDDSYFRQVRKEMLGKLMRSSPITASGGGGGGSTYRHDEMNLVLSCEMRLVDWIQQIQEVLCNSQDAVDVLDDLLIYDKVRDSY